MHPAISCLVATERRRAILAFPLGAMVVLALPPFAFVPLAILSFGGLFLILQRCGSPGGAFWIGWCFGIGFFFTGLHWIGNSFYNGAEGLEMYAIPAVAALVAYLAVFPAIACGIAVGLAPRGIWRALALAAGWTLCELVRGAILPGFPWNLVGYVALASDEAAQGAAVVGIYGLSFVLVLSSTLGARAIEPGLNRRVRYGLAAASMVLILGPLSYGVIRLEPADEVSSNAVRLRLVQGNVPQKIKWAPALRGSILDHYARLSQEEGAASLALVIWPETAVPYMLAEDETARKRVAQAAPRGGLIVAGTLRRSDARTGTVEAIHNSVIAIDSRGAVVDTYDKVRLVPFGEYVPLRRFLPLIKLSEGATDFTPGPAPRVLRLSGVPPVQPLICYEAIFPGFYPAPSSDPPKWMLNLTNDAWFGVSIGPYQHLAMARMRAIERGMPLVRAANTGISAVVDSYGRVVASLHLNETGVLDVLLPKALDEKTSYQRSGDWPVLTLSVLAIAASAMAKGVRV